MVITAWRGPGPAGSSFSADPSPLRWGCSEHPGRAASRKADWEQKSGHALKGLGRGQTVRKVGGPDSTVSPSRTGQPPAQGSPLRSCVCLGCSGLCSYLSPPGVKAGLGTEDAVFVRRVTHGETVPLTQVVQENQMKGHAGDCWCRSPGMMARSLSRGRPTATERACADRLRRALLPDGPAFVSGEGFPSKPGAPRLDTD